MKLYFDIGNTNIKLNFVENENSKYVSYSSKTPHTVDSFWQQLPLAVKNSKPTLAMVCAVVPELKKMVVGMIKKYFHIQPFVITKGIKTKLQLQIDHPETLGSDLVALGALAHTMSDNTIIVNLGTATTIIHVKNHVFLGAIIMPGIEIQLTSIVAHAARISTTDISYQSQTIGKNTSTALALGIINSHLYAIDQHIKNIDSHAQVVISGGNQKYLCKYTNYQCLKEATIAGMKVIAELNGI